MPGVTPIQASVATEGGSSPVLEKTDLYQAIYDYVKQYMSAYDPSHDFKHVLRVRALADRILAEESKRTPHLDRQAVILGALLHDVGDRKYLKPGEETHQMIEDLLSNLNCPRELAVKIALIVENTSFSNEIKKPEAVKQLVASHPELAIVQDADRLDAIGAIGIGRCFVFGGVKAPERGLQGTIDHFSEKLEKLEGMMKTETGRQLAAERTQRLKTFREWWEDEWTLEA